MAISKVGLTTAVTGTLPAANGGTGATSFSPGKVLQVVEGSFTGHTTTVASTTAVDLESASSTTWETAITPSATSNKILISASITTVPGVSSSKPVCILQEILG
jgi:hypothetical protein